MFCITSELIILIKTWLSLIRAVGVDIASKFASSRRKKSNVMQFFSGLSQL